MKKIIVKDIAENALSESAGTKLRNKILEIFEENKNEAIVLDFSGVLLFATMFFNSSIGYLISKNSEAVKNITIENISQLGMDTLKHSKENALKLREHPDVDAVISDCISGGSDE